MPCVPRIHPLSIISKLSMPATVEKKQKPRNGHRPYAPCTLCAPKNSDTPQTSAINKPRTVQDQLTLHDWLSVVQYVNTQYLIAFTSLIHNEFGSVTFLAEVMNGHTLWHISPCIKCHYAYKKSGTDVMHYENVNCSLKMQLGAQALGYFSGLV